jgi:nitroreductase
MSSRRSCRKYQNKPINNKILNDIIKIGTLAPSGTNCQQWSFITLPNRESIEQAATYTEHYFRKLNKLAKNIFIRNGLKLFGNSELDHYYKEYMETVQEALDERKNCGIDRLFHGAPAAIIVCGDTRSSCPAEDAMLATQNMLLAIHAMGLESCLIGFMVEAIKHDKNLKKFLKLVKYQKVYSVIALGYP